MNVRLAAAAMGTRFELVLSGEDEFFLRSVGEQALAAVEDEHRRLSLFDPQSLISRLNREAAGHPVAVDQDLFELLLACRRVWSDSEGAFDPAVGELMRSWGHRGESAPAGPPAGFERVRLDEAERTVAFTGPGVALDLGGVAKGYALDRAAALIREAGVEAALLHGGTSSIVAIGAPPGAAGWRVRIPPEAMQGQGGELVLRDLAASVSAPAGRVSAAGAGHIMDPRTGSPATCAAGAIVVGEEGLAADAWSTALVVLARRPDRMPPEIGSAVCVNGAWTLSPAIEGVFSAVSRNRGTVAE